MSSDRIYSMGVKIMLILFGYVSECAMCMTDSILKLYVLSKTHHIYCMQKCRLKYSNIFILTFAREFVCVEFRNRSLSTYIFISEFF